VYFVQNDVLQICRRFDCMMYIVFIMLNGRTCLYLSAGRNADSHLVAFCIWTTSL